MLCYVSGKLQTADWMEGNGMKVLCASFSKYCWHNYIELGRTLRHNLTNMS